LLGRLAEAGDARAAARSAAAALARWAGVYDGGHRVELADGRLWYRRRAAVMPEELLPLGGDRFAAGATRFAFETSGATARLTIERPDGSRLAYPRTAAVAAAP
ncbi:hypothetical protein, partial [Roseisolibacter sp. H3M3-2]|uniref:hypothetical protein n=1 Tax=Roseisolibacter sp. H3M3-2 TaxID=3031323 RepID=UPI0023D9E217